MEIPIAFPFPFLAYDFWTLSGIWKLAPVVIVLSILCADCYYTQYRAPPPRKEECIC